MEINKEHLNTNNPNINSKKNKNISNQNEFLSFSHKNTSSTIVGLFQVS